jgi:hypothetical protein
MTSNEQRGLDAEPAPPLSKVVVADTMRKAACSALNERGQGNAITIADVNAMLSAALGSAPAEQQVTVTDFATRLFDLHGFMLLETYRDKPAVTVTFPDLKQAQQFHDALVELSTHRPRPRSLLEGSIDG